jgi:uncharacterized protein
MDQTLPTPMTSNMRLETFLERRATPPYGEGVFTRRALMRGACVITFTGPLLRPAEADNDLHCLQIAPELYMGPSGNFDDYLNHSCEPNLGFVEGSLTLSALRDIAAGEQLLWDYSTAMNEPGWSFPCKCGTKSCRGVVRSFLELSPAEKEKLRTLTLAYLRTERTL